MCNPYDTIARARAYLLHILYELGKSQHQFRLRFKGEYLRDCHTFDVSSTGCFVPLRDSISSYLCILHFSLLFRIMESLITRSSKWCQWLGQMTMYVVCMSSCRPVAFYCQSIQLGKGKNKGLVKALRVYASGQYSMKNSTYYGSITTPTQK